MTSDSEGKDRVSFRIDAEKLEELDDLIWENKVSGDLPRDVNRSDLLRSAVDDLIEDLEGNSRTPETATAD